MRKVFKLGAGGERQVRMVELRKGDKFRLVTDDAQDYIYGKASVVYVAQSDAREIAGSWGVDIDDESAKLVGA